MEVYEKEVWLNLSEKKTKNWNDKIILFSNKWSNDFGASWLRGFVATVLINSVVFIISLIALRLSEKLIYNPTYDNIANVIKLYFQILNVTNWNFDPLGIEGCHYFYVILFLGRIFIGYGYYQTISAFRKFGR